MRLAEIEDKQNAIFNQYKTAIKFAANRFKKGKAIYRGLNYEATGDQILFFDPTTRATPRKSANTHNYYTLWIDNSPAWQKFPKRSYSLICTTNINTAEAYGDAYVVIPTVNTTIGVCPTEDFWDSFQKTLGRYQLNDLMDFIHEVFLEQNIGRPETYEALRNALSKINVAEIQPRTYSSFLINLLQEHGAIGAFDYILDPIVNELTVRKWATFTFQPRREVWLSAPCVLIEYETFRLIADNKNPDFSLK